LNQHRIGDVVETSIGDVVETSLFRRWINFHTRLVCNPKSTSRRDVDSTNLQRLCAHWVCLARYMLSPVRPSVCPSVRWVDQSKRKRKSLAYATCSRALKMTC